MPLARFLETARQRRMVQSLDALDSSRNGTGRRTSLAHHYIIVARDRVALHQHFKEALAGNPSITVILDRRRGERRTNVATTSRERRQADRRWRAVDAQLRTLGWAIVRVAVHASAK